MQILLSIAIAAINLCTGSDAIKVIKDQISFSNGEHGVETNTTFDVATTTQAYGSSEKPDVLTNPEQTEYIRIESLFKKKNLRFCMQSRSADNPPIRIITKPCSDSDKQLFYVDANGFLHSSLNHKMCLMRFTTPKKQTIMVLDKCKKKKYQEKIWYSSFDGAIVVGRTSANLRAATFEGKVPKRNIVITMKERDYKSPGQLWKIEHVSTSSLYPSSEPTTFPTTTVPTVSSSTAYPTSTLSIKPSVVPTSTPSAEPSIVPSADLLL